MLQECFSAHFQKNPCKAGLTHLTSTKITESKIIIYNLSCTMVSCEAKTMQHKEEDGLMRNGLMLPLMHFSHCFLKV